MQKPKELFHGSANLLQGPLVPRMEKSTLDHIHSQAAVFATERADIAALFMFPLDTLASIGFENDIAYICVWGTAEEFAAQDNGGYLYILPADSFEKIGKEYEWQSFQAVIPKEIKHYDSVITGIMESGGHVYFINDEDVFDKIRDRKDTRFEILKNLTSENQKRTLK